MQNEVRVVIVRRGLFVDEYQLFALIVVDETRRGVDGQRSSADDEHIGFFDRVHRAVDGAVREHFAVQNDVRLDYPAALVAVRNVIFAVPDIIGVEELAAALAVVFVSGAVQVVDVPTARRLVQPVNVLGDDGGKFALVFEFFEG